MRARVADEIMGDEGKQGAKAPDKFVTKCSVPSCCLFFFTVLFIYEGGREQGEQHKERGTQTPR